jgi:hypothetical protein
VYRVSLRKYNIKNKIIKVSTSTDARLPIHSEFVPVSTGRRLREVLRNSTWYQYKYCELPVPLVLASNWLTTTQRHLLALLLVPVAQVQVRSDMALSFGTNQKKKD